MDAATLTDTHANSQLQSRLAALQDRPDSIIRDGVDEDFAHPSPRASISVANGRLLAPAAGATSFRGSYHQYLHPQLANNLSLQPGGLQANPRVSSGRLISSSPVPMPLRAPPRAHTRAGSESSSNGSIRYHMRLSPPTVTVRPNSVHVARV